MVYATTFYCSRIRALAGCWAFLGWFLLSALLVHSFSLAAEAQRPPDRALKIISEELNIPQSSKYFQKLVAKMSNDYNGDPEAAEVYDSLDWEKIQLVRHYRAKQGVKLPSKGEIRGVFHGMTEDDLFMLFKEGVKKYRELEKEWQKLPEIPNCKVSKKIIKDNPFQKAKPGEILGTHVDKVKDMLLLDILFVHEEDIPENPKEVYGKRVVVRRFEADNPFSEGAIAGKMKLDCLPYRYRTTFDKRMEYTGLEAMKNYDQDTYGDGEIHEWVRENYMKRNGL